MEHKIKKHVTGKIDWEGGNSVRTSSQPSPEEKGQNFLDDLSPSPLERLPAEVGVGVRFPSPEEKGQNYPDDITPSPLESLPAEVGVGARCRLLRGCLVSRVMRN
jgi:hypothetical protein